jgi:hypothetical protein
MKPLGGGSKNMEFMSKNKNDVPQAGAQHQGRKKKVDWAARTVRIEIFIILTGGALLLAAVSLYLGMSGGLTTQKKNLDESKYQAVFLNIGQVYFGKVTSINDKFLVLEDVFYVNCNTSDGSNNCQQNGNNTYTLYKLGVNELHAPQDKMTINQTQVAYWENIKDSSKVVQAIGQYKKNPNAANQVNSSGASGQNSATPPAATPSTNQNTTP